MIQAFLAPLQLSPQQLLLWHHNHAFTLGPLTTSNKWLLNTRTQRNISFQVMITWRSLNLCGTEIFCAQLFISKHSYYGMIWYGAQIFDISSASQVAEDFIWSLVGTWKMFSCATVLQFSIWLLCQIVLLPDQFLFNFII